MLSPKHQYWSSRWIFILATAGAAIGLGNVWKFPYMVGMNGGGAFMLVYLLSVLLIGIPIMMAEALLGRIGNADPVSSLVRISEQFKKPNLQFIAWWGLAGLIIVLSFYSVLSGFVIAYFFRTAAGSLTQVDTSTVNQVLNTFLASPAEMLLWHTLFLIMTLAICARKLAFGIERATRWLMPLLFLMLLVLVVYAFNFGAPEKAIKFLFTYNPEALTPSVILNAMGHSFFTLALGAGAILAYGSYMPADTRLSRAIPIIAFLDTSVAILAGLAIFPIVFAHGLPPTQGPTLIFSSLPLSFANMPYGQFVGSLFFLFLLLAALTSSINLAEPFIATMHERYNLTRPRACALLFCLTWTLGIGSILSFNLWSDVHILGQLTFFDLMTQIPDKLILPIGGIAFALIAGWALDKPVAMRFLPMAPGFALSLWRFLIRYAAPVVIFAVMVNSYL